MNKKLKLNSFVLNLFVSYLIAFSSFFFQTTVFSELLLEPLIAGSVMVLLPGMAMTTGIRDTLEGDFMSGSARTVSYTHLFPSRNKDICVCIPEP